jgi:hypothetical protein
MLGSLTHEKIIVEAKGGLVDMGIGPPFNSTKSALTPQKPVSLTFHLRIPLGNCMLFTGFRDAAEVFRAKIRFQHAVRIHNAKG